MGCVMPRESNCLSNCTLGKGRAVGAEIHPSTCPQAAWTTLVPASVHPFTPFHSHPPSLILLSAVAGGEVYGGVSG